LTVKIQEPLPILKVGKLGYIDHNGEVLITPRLMPGEEIVGGVGTFPVFSEGLAQTRRNGQWGTPFLERPGRQRKSPEDCLFPFASGKSPAANRKSPGGIPMILITVLMTLLLGGQQPQPTQTPAPPPASQTRPAESQARPGEQAGRAAIAPAAPVVDEKPVVTRHEINAGGKSLKYSVTTGFMPIKNAAGETEAHIFFMAYTLDGTSNAAERPLMFSFNGGPGSSSVWLHLGAIGPRRVKLLDDGRMPPPPFQLEDNADTWLDQTDLVFIDPVGTGYSRATKPELAAKFSGLQGDLASVGEFIRLYLTRYSRWSSPLFLVGESYGTTRAAGLAGYLIDRGIAFNGIVLISTVLNFETLLFDQGNDLPYPLILPSYTATAWYHKKLPADLQRQDLRKVLGEAETWAGGEYTLALAKGDRLTASERQMVVDRLARFTGLDKQFIDDANLRIDLPRFDKELLRDQKRSVGRLDSRFTGIDALAVGDRPDSDPSNDAIRPPYTAAFNNYVRSDLGLQTDLEYYVLGGGIGRWDWGVNNGFADTSENLRRAFAKNPYLKLFVACGYYDLATPYFAAQYTLSHMNLEAGQRANIRLEYYEAGHMVYIDTRMLAKLKQDVSGFVKAAMSRP
jgi:carboxypeptidase C (cathepsin A)